ncbi:MAG TPA: type II toxin-antitoxin system RelE/ParE family toxin [Candidatus Saccharimonadales bacterium]|nr:type II toxin-antitoxin system RelE/ParE family toxin [Candidatus Saccharimonadales bacterium]
MRISYSKNFIKKSKKLDKRIRDKVPERIELFSRDQFNSELNNHPLKGKYKGYRSINITGDFKALYLTYDDLIVFDIVNTHSELYG